MKASAGDAVRVHYTGKLEDGTVFDSSEEEDPLEFTVGEDQVIPGFEKAVKGMRPGESTTVSIDPDEAYGEHREDMVKRMSRDQIPDEVPTEVGQQLQLRMENGDDIPVIVTSVTDEIVTVDANHPLAGRTLVFDIEVEDIG
jgi:FKBP-type peptidyl-prolyl cis-trans isomerase 2